VPLISAQDLRGYVPAANDGIIATAGVIEGFIAAGAGTDALIAAAFAATVAGAVSFGGFKYGEAAAERDAELAVVEEERRDLARSPEGELEELAAYYEARGVDPALAREVATQVSARDALMAQLESEHGIRELMPANAPLLAGISGAFAFMLGAVLPVAVVILVPPDSRGFATAVAVILSLALTAIITAQLGRSSLGRTVLRSVLVGALTLLLSVIAGSFLPDPDGQPPASSWRSPSGALPSGSCAAPAPPGLAGPPA
jgi:VIT1/CCC1 family predicted Fe2+/Mn2+ transporter